MGSKVHVLPPPVPNRREHPYQGTIVFQGIPIYVENLRGSYREGRDPDGKPWRTLMRHHYGEVPGTEGADGDPVDVYVGPDAAAERAYVVHQKRPGTSKFDEDKVMLGFATREDALLAFRAQYNQPGFVGDVETFTVPEFKERLMRERNMGQKITKGLPVGARVRYVLKALPEQGGQAGRVRAHMEHTHSGKMVQVAEHATGRAPGKPHPFAPTEGSTSLEKKGQEIQTHPHAGLVVYEHAKPGADDHTGAKTGYLHGRHEVRALFQKKDGTKGTLHAYGKTVHEAHARAEHAISAHHGKADGKLPEFENPHQGSLFGKQGKPEPGKPKGDKTEAEMQPDDGPAQPGGRRDTLNQEYKLNVEGHRAGTTAGALKQGIERAADFCNQKPSPCKGNLGLERAEMPQLVGSPTDTSTVAGKFVKAYKDKGVAVKEEAVPVGHLKAIQKEINSDKVAGMVRAARAGKFDISKGEKIIVSKDNHILDGHHRWAAMLMIDPHMTMSVVRVDKTAKELVDDANKFEGVTRAGFGAPSDMSGKKDAQKAA